MNYITFVILIGISNLLPPSASLVFFLFKKKKERKGVCYIGRSTFSL